MNESQLPGQDTGHDSRRNSNVRWIICGLLFLAATVNYADRQVIGILKPTLQVQLHWSEVDYGHIIAAFQFAYALGYLLVGRLMDRTGSYRGFSLRWFFGAWLKWPTPSRVRSPGLELPARPSDWAKVEVSRPA